MDANANTLFAVFNYCNPAGEGGYLGIIQPLTFDSLLKVFFLCVMLELLLKWQNVRIRLQNHAFTIQANPLKMDQTNQLVKFLLLFTYFLDSSHSRIQVWENAVIFFTSYFCLVYPKRWLFCLAKLNQISLVICLLYHIARLLVAFVLPICRQER